MVPQMTGIVDRFCCGKFFFSKILTISVSEEGEHCAT